MSNTGFKTNNVDLKDIFTPYTIGDASANITHFKTSDQKDLNERFKKYTSGTKASATGFKVGTTDLCNIFDNNIVPSPTTTTTYYYNNAAQTHTFQVHSVRCEIAVYGAKNNLVGTNEHHGSFSLINLNLNLTEQPHTYVNLGVSIEQIKWSNADGNYANHAWFAIEGSINNIFYPVTGLQLPDKTYSIDLYKDLITPTQLTKTDPRITSIIHHAGTDTTHGYVTYKQTPTNAPITEFENQIDTNGLDSTQPVSGKVVIYEYSS